MSDDAIAKARRAASLAGEALDPNPSADLSLARTLLAAALELVREAGATAEVDAIAAKLEAAADRDELVAVEADLVAAIQRLERQRRPTARRKKATAIGLSVLVAAGVCAIPLVRSCSNRSYRFHTSSAAGGYFQDGGLTQQGAYGLLFHTNQEKRPWVEVDLGAPTPIRSIEVINRIDCCKDRAVPLRAELAGDDREFHEVARRDDPFDTWESQSRTERLLATFD